MHVAALKIMAQMKQQGGEHLAALPLLDKAIPAAKDEQVRAHEIGFALGLGLGVARHTPGEPPYRLGRHAVSPALSIQAAWLHAWPPRRAPCCSRA